jgi:hypothetical protein
VEAEWHLFRKFDACDGRTIERGRVEYEERVGLRVVVDDS